MIEASLRAAGSSAPPVAKSCAGGTTSPCPFAKLRPCRRRILISILAVNRQVSDFDVSDFDDAELQRGGRKFGKAATSFIVFMDTFSVPFEPSCPMPLVFPKSHGPE